MAIFRATCTNKEGEKSEYNSVSKSKHTQDDDKNKKALTGIKEDVKFIHNTKGCFKAFPYCKEKGKSSKTSFSSTKSFDVFRLTACILVILKRQMRTGERTAT